MTGTIEPSDFDREMMRRSERRIKRVLHAAMGGSAETFAAIMAEEYGKPKSK